MESRYFLVALWIITQMITYTTSRTLCPRIFFQNIDEDKMPYKIVEGVFVKQSYTHNAFPVYKRENDNLFFYLHKYNGRSSMEFGLKLGNYFGIAAEIRTYVTPSIWLATGSLQKSDVFNGLISKWYYWNDRDIKNYYALTPPIIKAICVDSDFRECNSDRVYMNVDFKDATNKVINNATTDYFSRSPGLFRNLRPVYRHNTQPWYLQYTSDQYWLVTSSLLPSSHFDSGAIMRVSDLALRPEYITKIWSVRYTSGWGLNYPLKVRCRGVSSMNNKCSTNPCRMGSTCVYTSGNETLCLCPSGYTGVRCNIYKQCSTLQPIYSKEITIYSIGKRPGDLAMTFCRGRYPSERFAICEDRSYSSYANWTRQACTSGIIYTTSLPYYTTPLPYTWPYHPRMHTPKAKPINFDDIPGLTPGILVSAILLQILLPFILWCCALCKKSWKEIDEEQEDERRRQQLGEVLENRLQSVTRAESREEFDQGVETYREAVEQYQRETEETELKRRKGFYRNASLCRLLSMDMYFSFFLWLIFLIVYEATEYRGVIFFALYIIAIIMLVIAPIVVLIESAFSHELDYIKNIMKDESAWSYIQRMQLVAPVINMTVECYHYETRTRVVYYTDANGNTQSRTETYQEKVVTFVDCDTYSFGSWVDVSKKEMPALSTVALTRLKIEPYILFGDQETADDFERQKENMLERNRHRDVFIDFSCNKEVPGLAKRISAYVDLQLKPWWIRPMYFWIATLLFMTWPYRWLFRAKTAKNYYDLKKKIYKSITPPREVDLMDPIALLQQCHGPSVPMPAALQVGQDYINPSFMSEMPCAQPQPPPYSSVVPAYSAHPPYPPTAPGSASGPSYPPTAPGNAPVFPPLTTQMAPSGPPPSYDAAMSQYPSNTHPASTC